MVYPDRPHERQLLDIGLCLALEDLLVGQDVLDLGAGIGHYGLCLLHKKEKMFPDVPEADEQFLEYTLLFAFLSS
jgi:16S rRNA G1207 methylase RsmC